MWEAGVGWWSIVLDSLVVMWKRAALLKWRPSLVKTLFLPLFSSVYSFLLGLEPVYIFSMDLLVIKKDPLGYDCIFRFRGKAMILTRPFGLRYLATK